MTGEKMTPQTSHETESKTLRTVARAAEIDPHERLTRRQLAEELTKRNFKTSPATLATMATRGGGPPFEKWGPTAVYQWGLALDWAMRRLSAPRSSTSEPLRHIDA